MNNENVSIAQVSKKIEELLALRESMQSFIGKPKPEETTREGFHTIRTAIVDYLKNKKSVTRKVIHSEIPKAYNIPAARNSIDNAIYKLKKQKAIVSKKGVYSLP